MQVRERERERESFYEMRPKLPESTRGRIESSSAVRGLRAGAELFEGSKPDVEVQLEVGIGSKALKPTKKNSVQDVLGHFGP